MRSKIVKGIAAVFVLLLLALSALALTLRERIPAPPDSYTVSGFVEVPSPFTHRPDPADLPFTGGAALDVDGDGASELFVSGGRGQRPALLTLQGDSVVDLAEDWGLAALDHASHGVTALDFDRDGDTDLLAATSNGVWLYTHVGEQFEAARLPITLPDSATPLNVAVADVNQDGLTDLYLSNFVQSADFRPATFNDPAHAKPNQLFLQQADGSFTDVTDSAGVAGVQNTFHSSFIDLDEDGRADLVLANNTGPIQIFRNMGSAKFQPVQLDSGHGYWMGLAAGDYDADGDTDLAFSNIGVSIPAQLVTGDLDPATQRLELEWKVYRNDGDFTFTDVSQQLGVDGFGFGWGTVFEDLDLDGQLDLLGAQNYIKWPPHQHFPLDGKALLQRDGKLWQAGGLGLDNRHFGQSPIIGDFNGDNRPDVAWINMAGPARILLNQSPAPVLRIDVPDQLTHGTVRVKLLQGEDRTLQHSRQIVQATGMGSDSSPHVFLALPPGQGPYALAVSQSGKRDLIRPLPSLQSGQTSRIPLPLRDQQQ